MTPPADTEPGEPAPDPDRDPDFDPARSGEAAASRKPRTPEEAEVPEESEALDRPAAPMEPAAPAEAGTPAEAGAADRSGAATAVAQVPPGAGPGNGGPGAGLAGGAAAGAGGPRRRVRWLRVAAACTAFLVLSGAGAAWYLYQRLDANITTDTVTENELKVQEPQRPTQGPTRAENILLIGSDNRSGSNAAYGDASDTQRSDTTILLHLAADRRSATAVSIPRDLMTHVPKCVKPDGGTVSARFEEFNWAFEFGGAACTIRAVEDMTHIRVDHHLVVDFTGFKSIVNAVGGVDVCLPQAVHDRDARLDLPAGRQKLNGEQALGYVRARHGLGDGSDTQRMDRQQDFLASLVKKVRSDGVLLNPVKLYPVLSAATKSLTADPGLDSLSELYGLAQSLQKIPDQSVHFLTAPREQYPADPNRDQLVQPDADRLFAALHDDVPVNVSDDGANSADGTRTGAPAGTPSGPPSGTPASGTSAGKGAGTNGGTSAAPTYRGTTADRDVCGKER